MEPLTQRKGTLYTSNPREHPAVYLLYDYLAEHHRALPVPATTEDLALYIQTGLDYVEQHYNAPAQHDISAILREALPRVFEHTWPAHAQQLERYYSRIP